MAYTSSTRTQSTNPRAKDVGSEGLAVNVHNRGLQPGMKLSEGTEDPPLANLSKLK